MKEVRFRAYSPTEKRFLRDGEFVIDCQGGIMGVTYDRKFVPWGDWDNPVDVVTPILQQFTGVTDKNFVEVYEGDIIRVEYGEIIVTIDVERTEGGWEINLNDVLGPGAMAEWLADLRDDQFEVVGNIFEDKELLGVVE